MIEDNENSRQVEKTIDNLNIRNNIIASGIEVFREKGYEKATIADIVKAASIGRSTFYKNFKDKKELFIECIKDIIFREMKKGSLEEKNQVRDEKDNLIAKGLATYAIFKK